MSLASSQDFDRVPSSFRGEAAGRGCGPNHLTVLGGGIAGLAVGFYAGQRSLPFTIYEAAACTGGLCVTFEWEGFLFDSGAHRFHDKDPEVTRDVLGLIGPCMRAVDRPSMIFDRGRLIRFPFRPVDVLWHLGPGALARSAVDLAAARIACRGRDPQSFASLARRRYGRTLARRFLLGYSEKLWGLPCERLSPLVSGERLKGFGLRQFLPRALRFEGKDGGHFEGEFYYPERGIGMLTAALAASCGVGTIRTRAEVRRVFHDGQRIQAIQLAGEDPQAVDEVVSTLPLDRLLSMMTPAPPEPILRLGADLAYRNLLLVALFLRRESVTEAATVYFPDPRIPFTRVTEPRNRSEAMSPKGYTSLVAEIPSALGESLWSAENDRLAGLVRATLEEIGWFQSREVLGWKVVRLPWAYPVLSLDVERSRAGIVRYLQSFSNLKLTGRNGRFQYGWIHQTLRMAKDLFAGHASALDGAAMGLGTRAVVPFGSSSSIPRKVIT